MKKNDVAALSGVLGAGKTAFTRGIARALGIDEQVTSPTYTIISEYEGPEARLFHIDAYRLSGEDDFIEAGGLEALEGGVAVIEWSERIKALLPKHTKFITIKILAGGQREIHYENCC